MRSGNSQDGNDRGQLFQGASHVEQPGVERGGSNNGPARLIGQAKGGMNTKLHAVSDAEGRLILLFLTAGQRRLGRHEYQAARRH